MTITFPARYAPLVTRILEQVKSRLEVLTLFGDASLLRGDVDHSRTGKLSILLTTDVAKSAKLLDVLSRPGVEVFTSRRATMYSLTVPGHPTIAGKTLLGCVEAIVNIEAGQVGTLDLDAPETADHLHVMGTR